jgi:hypothetical protein
VSLLSCPVCHHVSAAFLLFCLLPSYTPPPVTQYLYFFAWGYPANQSITVIESSHGGNVRPAGGRHGTPFNLPALDFSIFHCAVRSVTNSQSHWIFLLAAAVLLFTLRQYRGPPGSKVSRNDIYYLTIDSLGLLAVFLNTFLLLHKIKS